MSETLWKCNGEQLPSVKQLLGELKDDIAVLGLPGIDGVKQVVWVMTKIVTFGLHFTTQIHWTASFSFLLLLPLTLKPLYDTIWWVYLVQYDLTAVLGLVCTISISKPRILQYLVLGEL